MLKESDKDFGFYEDVMEEIKAAGLDKQSPYFVTYRRHDMFKILFHAAQVQTLLED